MARKLFEAKPLKPGATVEWTHLYPTGETKQRTGQVWSGAQPMGPGTKTPVWVIPFEPLPSDPYRAVVVAVRNGSTSWAAISNTCGLGRTTLVEGQAFSDNASSSATGGAAQYVANLAWQAKRQREAA